MVVGKDACVCVADYVNNMYKEAIQMCDYSIVHCSDVQNFVLDRGQCTRLCEEAAE